LQIFNYFILSNFIFKWKQKWNVNWLQFTLIITTFALGGSTCAYLSRKILSFFWAEKSVAYYIIYIILITLLWPFCVLMISILFGQFTFFKKYIQKILNRFFGRK
jgi:predicted permease